MLALAPECRAKVTYPDYGASHALDQDSPSRPREMPSDWTSHSSQETSRNRAQGQGPPLMVEDSATSRIGLTNLGPQQPTHCPAALGARCRSESNPAPQRKAQSQRRLQGRDAPAADHRCDVALLFTAAKALLAASSHRSCRQRPANARRWHALLLMQAPIPKPSPAQARSAPPSTQPHSIKWCHAARMCVVMLLAVRH